MNGMGRSVPFFIIAGISFILIAIYFNCHKSNLRMLLGKGEVTEKAQKDPWNGIPSIELALRMNSSAVFVNLYESWFLKSLKVFWPEDRLNLTLVLDDENEVDHMTGDRLSRLWPKPKVVYLNPGDPAVYQGIQRRRMYLDYFFPEKYATKEYVAFVDADTMFVSVITPESLFAEGKATVQARIGEPFWQQHWECWSDVTEYLIGKKEALQCMSYFPIIIKVEHIVELRDYISKRFGRDFLDVFKDSLLIKNAYFEGSQFNDCMCQFSVICNYVWYFHREEYDFHLEMTPDDTWNGENLRQSQQPSTYIKDIDKRFKMPKPRVAIHARHYQENGLYVSGSSIDTTKEPYNSQLERRIQEGVCFAIGFDRCPKQCYSFDRNGLQQSLYSFEMFDWLWDLRCLNEQKQHYKQVKKLIEYNEKHGKRMFGLDPPYEEICDGLFEE